MASHHPLANSDRSRADEKASAAEAAAWLMDPDKAEQHVVTHAEQLAAEPPWTGPDPEPEDE